MRTLYMYPAAFMVLVFLGAANAGDRLSAMRAVDVEELISSLVAGGGDNGWVISGELDVDEDGDMDVLITSSSVTSESQLSKGGYTWSVYFNEGGDFFYSDTESMLPFYGRNIEYRRVRQSDGKRTLLWRDNDPDGGGNIIAVWYEKSADGGVSQERIVVRSDSLIALQNDEVGGAGLSIDMVLKNYRRFESSDVRPHGVTLPERERTPMLNKAHAEERDATKGGAGNEEAMALRVALVVLASLGFVAAFAFYRRRRG